jgi:myotubularin-related protein 6/7/8
MRNRPLAFEFNERFLLELNEHAYSCVYGQFIGNCDKDREASDNLSDELANLTITAIYLY